MTLDELKKAFESLSPEDRGALSDWIADREMEEELNRRIAEAEADPSILIPGDQVMAEMRAAQEKHREELRLSPTRRK